MIFPSVLQQEPAIKDAAARMVTVVLALTSVGLAVRGIVML